MLAMVLEAYLEGWGLGAICPCRQALYFLCPEMGRAKPKGGSGLQKVAEL